MAPQFTRRVLLLTVLIQLITARSLFGDEIEDDGSVSVHSMIEADSFKVDPHLFDDLDDFGRTLKPKEASTSSTTPHPFEHICPHHFFACNNGECIAPKWRCDGHYDCDDFSDELNCTTLDLPQHGSIAPTATTYIAPPRPNTTQVSALSTQVYGLDFNSSVEPLMIFSTGSSIRGLWMQSRIYFDVVIRNNAPHQLVNPQPSITEAFSLFFSLFGPDPRAETSPAKQPPSSKPESTIVGLDMDPNTKEVFWVELGKEPGVYSAILEDGIDGKPDESPRRQFHGHKKVVEYGLLSPEDIALDIVGRNAYITDGALPAVVVCSYQQVHCKIIVRDNIHKPRAIIADSSTGWITFTDWGDRPGIYMASMDGRRFETLIETDVVWPNGLAADHSTNQLYWADARLNKIERVDLTTRQRVIIVKEVNTNPFSVSLFENRIYWSDWAKNEIKTCNKITGNSTKVVMHADDIYGIHIYHPDLHKDDTPNPCWSKRCSHLCLLTPKASTYAASRKRFGSIGASCACPDSMTLSSMDQETCHDNDAGFLVVNVRNYVAQMFPEQVGLRVFEEVVYSKEHAVQDVAFGWSNNFQLYFFDASSQAIYSIHFSDHVPSIDNLTATTSKTIRGLTYDQRVNSLFWLDPEKGSLVMFSIEHKFQEVLRHNLDHPASMVVDSMQRVLYISLLGSKPRIIRTEILGGEQSDVVLVDQTHREGGLGLPVALHLDPRLQRLYWADARLETIESIDLDIKSRSTGTRPDSRRVYRRRVGTILSLTIYQDSFIWAMQNENYLFKAKIVAPKNSRPIPYKLPPNPSREHLSSDYKRLLTVDPTYLSSIPIDPPIVAVTDSSHKSNALNEHAELGQSIHAEEHPHVIGYQLQVKDHYQLQVKDHGHPVTQMEAEIRDGVKVDTKAGDKAEVKAEVKAEAVTATETATETATGRANEGSRVVWLIVFLLILSATGIVTVLSLLMLHRQGRLPRQVSVSFISPGRSQDKDRAMLLLDTDS